MTEQEIIEVVKGCSENNRKHQEFLYKVTYKKMMSIVRVYIDCPYIAEEILNDGYLRIFKKIEQFSFQGSFEGWMRKIMFHAVSDAVRLDKRIISKNKEGFKHNIGIDNIEVVTTMPDNASYKDLLGTIGTLPEQMEKVFRLYLLGYTHIEIGRKLGISEGTSKWNVSKAREKLKSVITY